MILCQRNKHGPNSDLAEVTFQQKNKIVLRQSDTKSECFKTIKKLKPYQESGKPLGNGKWPLNRGWLLNRGKGNGRYRMSTALNPRCRLLYFPGLLLAEIGRMFYDGTLKGFKKEKRSRQTNRQLTQNQVLRICGESFTVWYILQALT